MLSVDYPEVARSHVRKTCRLEVQLGHNTERLLLELVRHIDHELLDLHLPLFSNARIVQSSAASINRMTSSSVFVVGGSKTNAY